MLCRDKRAYSAERMTMQSVMCQLLRMFTENWTGAQHAFQGSEGIADAQLRPRA